MNMCSKNAFYFYKLQFEEKNRGKTFHKGITDIEVAAIDSWRTMTLQQREPFEDLAKKAAPNSKMTITNKNALLETTQAESNKTITEIVRQSFLNGTVETQVYHFIAANIFCQTAENKFYPAELALLKFTLRDGVIKTFHTFINPENIPLGYRFDAMKVSRETHQLPLPPNAKGEKNFARILQEINRFLDITTSIEWLQKSIPLFSSEEDIPMIQSICQEFYSTTKNTDCRFEILSINQLLFDLKTGVIRNIDARTSQFKCIDDATIQLNLEKYLYLNQVGCQFHDENDCGKYCCLSTVNRWAYAISENICIDLNICLASGQHFPVGVKSTQKFEHSSTNKEVKSAITSVDDAVDIKLHHLERKFDLNENLDSFSFVRRLTSRVQEQESTSSVLGMEAMPNDRGRSRGRSISFGRRNFVRSFGRGRTGRGHPC